MVNAINALNVQQYEKQEEQLQTTINGAKWLI